MLKSKLDGLKKGEFETTEEFKLRTADVENLIKPINTSDLYAFKPHAVHLKKYNPDTQSYLIDLLCAKNDTYSSSKHKNLVTCFTVAAKIDNSTSATQEPTPMGLKSTFEPTRAELRTLLQYQKTLAPSFQHSWRFIRKDEHIYYFHKFYGLIAEDRFYKCSDRKSANP